MVSPTLNVSCISPKISCSFNSEVVRAEIISSVERLPSEVTSLNSFDNSLKKRNTLTNTFTFPLAYLYFVTNHVIKLVIKRVTIGNQYAQCVAIFLYTYLLFINHYL